jgi:hypothetical protein
MKLGIVLPSWFYDERRKEMAVNTFSSLGRTKSFLGRPDILMIVKEETIEQYVELVRPLEEVFEVTLQVDTGLTGTEQPLAFGTEWLFGNRGVDYVTWMGDDALFHPEWLVQLVELIERHPDAIAWSVYRSNHEKFHAPLEFVREDVLVKSICGHGLTLGKNEWSTWGVRWEDHGWAGVEKMTLDLLHAQERNGARWVTKKSYVEHTGWRQGRHCTGCEEEYAKEFQGVGF